MIHGDEVTKVFTQYDVAYDTVWGQRIKEIPEAKPYSLDTTNYIDVETVTYKKFSEEKLLNGVRIIHYREV